MSDVDADAGGETVFVNAFPEGGDASDAKHLPYDAALQIAKDSGATALFEQNSWQERMVVECRTRLSFKPKRAKAILFYSQHPDGRLDVASKHGGCPVLGGKEKWAANLWIW